MVERTFQRLTEGLPETIPADETELPPAERLRYREFADTLFPHYFRKSWSGMHTDFAGRMDHFHEKRRQRQCFVAPREGAKTTHWSKIYPIYCICYELEQFILLGGQVVKQPQRNLAAIKKELATNLELARRFPHVAGVGPIWNESEIMTRNGVQISCVGRGTATRGVTREEYRPTLMVFDDLDDDDSLATTESRDKSWDWLTSTAIPLGVSESCNVVIVDTLKHEDDITQRCKQTPGWGYHAYKSISKWPDRMDLWAEWAAIYRQQTIDKNQKLLAEDADPALEFYLAREEQMKAGAVVLWPEKEPLYSLMVYIEENGRRSFDSEKNCEAPNSKDSEWPPELFDERTIMFSRWPYCQKRGMACDPSKGKTDRSDYSAWVWGGIAADGLIYVDADIRRRDAHQICVDGVNVGNAFKPHAIAIESDSYGAILELWKKICEEMGGDELPDIRMGNSQENKLMRIRRKLTGYLRKYRIRFKSDSPGVKLLLSQMKGFPKKTEHDDGPDALEVLLRLLEALVLEADDGPYERAGEENLEDFYSVG